MSEVLSPDEARAAREAVATLDVGRPLPPMQDAEVAALWRQTKALADSGLFSGARQGEALTAGQAFAKALAGRELGLGPFEAMQQLHVLPDGKLEASSDLHATKVREREGYDFEVWWIKSRTGQHYYDAQSGEVRTPDEHDREAVRAADDDPRDLRTVVGCALRFIVDGEARGVSTWTVEDTLRANLQRDRGRAKSLHVSYPRSMYFARAMTNGVAWYVPEAMGGLRVYGLGELPRDDGPDLTRGEGRPPVGEDPTDALPTEAEAIVARARTLGHVGLSDRATALMAVQSGAESYRRWLATATKTLNRLAAAKGEPVDSTAVEEPEAQKASQTPAEAQTPEPTQDPVDAPQAPQEAGEAGDPAEPAPDEAAERVSLESAIADAERAAQDAAERGDEATAQFYASEAAAARERLAGLDPDQGSLDVDA